MKGIGISIKARFNIILAIIIITFFVISIIFGVILNRNERYRNYIDKFTKLELKYNKLIQHENQFLIYYQQDESFIQGGKNEDLENFEQTYDSIMVLLEDISASRITKNAQIGDKLYELKTNTNNYLKALKKLANKLHQRGSVKYGRIGEIETSYKNALDEAKNPMLKQFAGRLKQKQVAYLYYNDETSYGEFIQIFTELNAYINQLQKQPIVINDSINSDSIQIQTNISNPVNNKYIKSINNLKKHFSALIKLDKEIGRTSEEGIYGDLRSEVAKLDKFDDILMRVNQKRKQNINNTEETFLILTIVFIFLLIIIMLQFSNSITKPLNLLKSYIEPLSKGILPEKPVILKTNDEMQQMGSGLNELISGLKKTTSFASTIGSGVFDTDFKPLSEKDVLGNSLLEMRKNLYQAQKEEEKRKHEDSLRKWTNEGLTQFSEILRQSTSNISELSSNIIKSLVHFLEANQGGLFLYNDNSKNDIHLELVASYAYNQERKKKKKIYMGEGLIGTCAIEKSTIYMTELPEDYLTITSGLGKSTPNSLLIVPLKVEEQIFGVVEIASFKKFEKYEIEFVEKVSESISSTLSIAKINQRTAELLEQSQQQAEEMASQEEEMRQNLEELQATQEESARKEAEMQSILNAINSSSLVVEYDLKGKIINVNESLLNLLGLNKDQMIGRHQGDFSEMDESHIRTSDFWERIRDGEIIKKTEKIKVKDREYWLHEVYTPILDADGFPYKILNMATDITSSKLQELELIEQAEEMAAQEEEMRQNLEELQTTQEQMIKQQEELEVFNKKLTANDQILRKALSKSKEAEKELQKKNNQLQIREQELKQKQNDIEKQNETLQKREQMLAETLKKTKENEDLLKQKNMQLAASEEELRQNMEELQATQEQLETQQEELSSAYKQLARREAEMSGRLYAINQTNLLAEYNVDGTIIRINDRYCDLIEYFDTDLIGKNHRAIVSNTEKKSKQYKEFWKSLQEGKFKEGEFKRITKSGEEVHIRAIFNPIFDDNKDVYKILEIGHDITETIKQRAELEGQLDAINSTNIFIKMDVNGTILEVNENFTELFGYNSTDILKRNHKYLIEEQYKKSEEYKEKWLDLSNGHSVSGEFTYLDKEKSNIHLRGVYTPVKGVDNKVNSIIFLGFDITIKKVQEDSLKLQAKEMIAQEEELKQNLEMLLQTQQEMERKQQILEKNQIRFKKIEKDFMNQELVLQQKNELLSKQKEDIKEYITQIDEFIKDLTDKKEKIPAPLYKKYNHQLETLLSQWIATLTAIDESLS